MGGAGLAVGSTLGVMISGVLPWGDPPRGGNFWIMVVVCGIFAFAGCISLGHALAAICMRRRRSRLAARFPGDPAMADYPWDRERSTGQSQRGLGLLPMAVVVTLIMGLSNYFLFNDDMPTMIQGVVWLGNLVAFFLWVAVIVGWLRRWKFAPGQTLFWEFPFSTGFAMCP